MFIGEETKQRISKILFDYKEYEHPDNATLSGHNYSKASVLHVNVPH